MKKYALKSIYVLLITLINPSYAIAQTCPFLSMTFETQESIDSFSKNYPTCSRIDGPVIISGEDITNISGLRQITYINGSLWIRDNPILSSLEGLENLTFTYNVIIKSNPKLHDISSFKKLVNVEVIQILENEQLYTMDFHSIHKSNLSSLFISKNPQLNSIVGFDSLEHLRLDLYIQHCPRLVSLHTFRNLKSIGLFLVLLDLPKIESLTDFRKLSSIGSVCYIGSNDLIQDLRGLDSLTYVGGTVTIDSNQNLKNLSGIENLKVIGGSLEISNNPQLGSLTDLEQLRSINGHLVINNNKALKTLSGIDNLDPKTLDNLVITDCDSLSICSVKSICKYLGNFENTATIENNYSDCLSRIAVTKNCSSCPNCFIRRNNSWIGPTQGDWNESPNFWSAGELPQPCDDVSIPEDYSITLAPLGSAQCFTLNLSQNATLEVPDSSTLMINCCD